jgi:hypothetical protein
MIGNTQPFIQPQRPADPIFPHFPMNLHNQVNRKSPLDQARW